MEDEIEANKILSACTRLVLFIAKNKFNNFGYKAMMEMLLLDKEKKELINSVLFRRSLNTLIKFNHRNWKPNQTP